MFEGGTSTTVNRFIVNSGEYGWFMFDRDSVVDKPVHE